MYTKKKIDEENLIVCIMRLNEIKRNLLEGG